MPVSLLLTDHIPLSLEQRLRLGVRLQQLRRERSLTVAQVANAALGYSRSHAGVSRLERAILAAISVPHLEGLSRFFETDLRAFLDTYKNVHFNPYAEVQLHAHAVRRVAHLHGALRFGGQAQERMKRFEDMLAPARLKAWEEGTEAPDLDTLDRLSKYFDLTRSWLPAGE